MHVAQQIGAVPLRREADGTQFVLLVTSRDTRRWIIPKGWPWPGVEDWIAATEEAREEGRHPRTRVARRNRLVQLREASRQGTHVGARDGVFARSDQYA